ncbi:hypothetical protein CWE13_07735 [Aliidiomarina shirensis]|uniref:TonB C-terminal domain-containing protein n=1 Tax=Aliidiomarina shirensis TaxID=1048642 RepID=A0A432WSI3_9GAMM|nr:energy transducer TonB [Aliidiomarina shirensis]RUO36732.1 hypothetical protein CWE13_07735 [Aliidiomarina shirensis]
MKRFALLLMSVLYLAGCASPYTPRDMEYFDTTDSPIMYGKNWALERKTMPVYPLGAGLNGQSGCVILSFTINKTGRPTNIEVVQSYPTDIFEHNARVALSFWRWSLIENATPKPHHTGVQLFFYSGLESRKKANESCDLLNDKKS